jgi:hypothetical protein
VVYERIERELCFDCLADTFGRAHSLLAFPEGCGGGFAAQHESISRSRHGKKDGDSCDIGPRYSATCRRGQSLTDQTRQPTDSSAAEPSRLRCHANTCYRWLLAALLLAGCA